jgi:division protein CdvB (Snf7/Vps24/ESCRT-III family)
MTSSLDELETTLNAVTARLTALSQENQRLRTALAEQSARMRAAGHRLRVVAERLPQSAAGVSVDAAPEEKAA